MADWRNGVTAERQTAERLNGGTAEWRDRVMAEQQNGGTTELQVFRCFHVRHQIYRTIIYPCVPLFFRCIAVTVQNSPFQIHIHTCIMENGKISKRPADSATAASKQSKKKKWTCKTNDCNKQAQTGCSGHCKGCFKVFSLNLPQIDLTQASENLASSGTSGINNAPRFSQCSTISFQGCASSGDRGRAGLGDRGSNNVTASHNEFLLNQPRIDFTQGAENVASSGDRGGNNATVSLQCDQPRHDLIQGAEYLASLGDRGINNGTVLPQCDTTSFQDSANLGDHGSNNGTMSLQRGAPSIQKFVSAASMEYVANLENRINIMESQQTNAASMEHVANLENRINIMESQQTNATSMEHVAKLENMINEMEIQMRNVNQTLDHLKEMLRDRLSPFLTVHSFTSGQDNSMDIPTGGLSVFTSSSRDSSKNPPRNRTSRTHQDTLARCDSTYYNDTLHDNTPHAGLKNVSVICYANAIFQALASFHHHTTLFNDLPQYTSNTYPLNHAFCKLLHTMVMSQSNQESVTDANDFLKLFCNLKPDFRDVECKFGYDIFCLSIQHNR